MEKASRYDPTVIGQVTGVLGWTDMDVAQKMTQLGTAISHQTIANWRNGLSAPDADKLDVLAMALGIGVERFYPEKS